MNTALDINRPRSQPRETIFFHGYDVIVIRGPLRKPSPEEPTKREGVLMCYEESCDRMTLHNLVGRRLVSTRKTGVPLYDEILYSCSHCGGRRVWGTEEVKKTSEKKQP